MGRLLNDFVTEGIKNFEGQKPVSHKCECGLDATYRCLDKQGNWIYKCDMHFDATKVRAHKKIIPKKQ